MQDLQANAKLIKEYSGYLPGGGGGGECRLGQCGMYHIVLSRPVVQWDGIDSGDFGLVCGTVLYRPVLWDFRVGMYHWPGDWDRMAPYHHTVHAAIPKIPRD